MKLPIENVITSKRLIEIIDEVVAMGTISVFLTGGEAMLRKDSDYIHYKNRIEAILFEITG